MKTKKQASAAETLAQLVEKIQFSMLTTVSGENGSLRSRPMTLQRFDADGTFWYFAGRSMGLVKDIRANAKVNLAFADPDTTEYVSATGNAKVVEDHAKAKELWHTTLKTWFPEGLKDPELCLIKVEVDSADYWETPSAKVTQLVGFAKAMLTGKKAGPELGVHRHVSGHPLH